MQLDRQQLMSADTGTALDTIHSAGAASVSLLPPTSCVRRLALDPALPRAGVAHAHADELNLRAASAMIQRHLCHTGRMLSHASSLRILRPQSSKPGLAASRAAGASLRSPMQPGCS